MSEIATRIDDLVNAAWARNPADDAAEWKGVPGAPVGHEDARGAVKRARLGSGASDLSERIWAALHRKEFNPDQERDEHGRWESGGLPATVPVDAVAAGQVSVPVRYDLNNSYTALTGVLPEFPQTLIAAASDGAISEKRAEDSIENWGTGSTTMDGISLQAAAAQRYDLGGTGVDQIRGMAATGYPADPEHQREAAAFIDAQYRVTQDALQAAGTGEITVYRGLSLYESSSSFPDGLRGVGLGRNVTGTIDDRPLASWSTSYGTARYFAQGLDDSFSQPGAVGYVMAARVPAERVFSLAQTGLGQSGEQEVVLLGGQLHVGITQVELPEEAPHLRSANPARTIHITDVGTANADWLRTVAKRRAEQPHTKDNTTREEA